MSDKASKSTDAATPAKPAQPSVQDLDVEAQLDALIRQIESAAPGLVGDEKNPDAAANPQASAGDPMVSLEQQIDEFLKLAEQSIDSPSATVTLPPPNPTAGKVVASDENLSPDAMAKRLHDAAMSGNEAQGQLENTLQNQTGDEDEDFDANEFAAPEDLIGDDLASQIQALLDDDKQPEMVTPMASASAPTPAALASAAPAPVMREAAAAPQTFAAASATPKPAPVQSQAAASPAPQAAAAATAPAPADVDAAEDVHEIDAYLAEHADEAIAGDFETVDDVINAKSGTDDATDDDTSLDDEDLPDGAFESPEQIMADDSAESQQKRGGFAATAQDVARELDDQPENKSRVRDDDEDDEPAQTSRRGFRDGPGRNAVPVEMVRRVCATLNRPLARASKSNRDLVGICGLITLFSGSIALVGALMRVIAH